MKRDSRPPKRLVDDPNDTAGRVLREALPLYDGEADAREPSAFARLAATETERRRERRGRRILLSAALACGVSAAIAIAGHRLVRAPETAGAPMVATPTETRLAAAASTRLPDGTELALRAGGEATLATPAPAADTHADGAPLVVSLARGELTVRSRPASAARALHVVAGSYRLEVAASDAHVEVDGAAVRVSVERGEVRVMLATRLVDRVVAGARWTNVPEPAPLPPPAPTPPAAPAEGPGEGPSAPIEPAPAPRREHARPTGAGAASRAASASIGSAACMADVRAGETRRAESCFEQAAAAPTADAEQALYELARMRHRALGDDAGAARALAESRRRFPRGPLRAEVDVLSLEVLGALGRYDEAMLLSSEALRETDGRGAEAEESARLHLLRGRLLQGHLDDCAGAVKEYAAAEGALGARRAEVAFFRGQCLERLGRRADALDAYHEAVSAPESAYARRAQARIDELGR
jgi:hypothetical protein